MSGSRSTYGASGRLVDPDGVMFDERGIREQRVDVGTRLQRSRKYSESTSTLLTSNRPIDDWGKLLGDTAAVTALLDGLLHHAHVLKCGPRSWRTSLHTDLRTEEHTK